MGQKSIWQMLGFGLVFILVMGGADALAGQKKKGVHPKKAAQMRKVMAPSAAKKAAFKAKGAPSKIKKRRR